MKFAVSKGETSLTDLTSRLFDIKGQGSAATAKRSEAALLAANPQLADLSRVPAGTLIVIPDLPDSPPVKAAQTAGIGAELGDQLKAALKELSDAIGRSAESDDQAVAATNELLKNRELKDFAAQSPAFGEQLAKITGAAKDQLKETKATTAAAKEALAELQNALGKISL